MLSPGSRLTAAAAGKGRRRSFRDRRNARR
jgi:hypothetical protein